MYGSYGSYSALSAPMDITPSYSYLSSRAPDASCAFPSWPRRSSLSESDQEERATSYLSDEDLFPSDPFESDYHSDAHSVSSANSSSSNTPSQQQQEVSEAEMLEMQRERAAYQREVMRFLAQEKERRRTAMMKKGRRSAGSSSSSRKASPKSKLAAMTPIAEAE